MVQYLRNWVLTITPITRDADGNYITGKSRAFTELRVVFDLKNTFLGDPSTGYFQIYNISQTTKDILANSLCNIQMEIGYGSSTLRLLFKGEVTNSYEIRQGTDTVQQIWARDSGFMLEDYTLPAKSYGMDKTPYFLLNDIVSTAPGLTSTIKYVGSAAQTLKDAAPIDNYSNTGEIKDQINNLTRAYKLKWTTVNNTVIVTSEEDIVEKLEGDTDPFTVSINTGLLKRPTVDYVGVSFEHLMNTRFIPGSLVKINKITVQRSFGNEFYVPIDEDRSELDSLYRVMEAQHKGDTRGQNWTSLVRVYTKVGS